MELRKDVFVQIRVEAPECTAAREAFTALSREISLCSCITDELPQPMLFALYARSTLDDDVLERAFDRLDRLVHWVAKWRLWHSARALNQPEEIERLRVGVEAVEAVARKAKEAVLVLMYTPRPDTATSRLLALRIGLAGLIDSRQRILVDDRRDLQRALERLLEASDWTV